MLSPFYDLIHFIFKHKVYLSEIKHTQKISILKNYMYLNILKTFYHIIRSHAI